MPKNSRLKPLLYLVAIDGSPSGALAREFAAELSAKMGAELRVVTVEDLQHLPRGGGKGPARPQLQRMLRDAAEVLVERERASAEKKTGPVSDKVLSGADAAQAIVKYAESEGADMIIVGSRGLAGIQRVLLGSVAQKVVHLAHCPVLVVR